MICQAVRTAGDEGFLLGQRPGTNPVRQRGIPVPTDKPMLIVSSRALSSADKREWKEITTLHRTVFQPTVHLTLGLRMHCYTFYTLNFSLKAERRSQINSNFFFLYSFLISLYIPTSEIIVELNYLLMRSQCFGLAHGFVYKL